LAKPRDISGRAARCWQRLTEWYGVRLAESYGTVMPKDWAEVVDRTDNDTVLRGLSIVRHRYLQHPPTLPQFEQAMEPPATLATGPNPAEQLCAYVMRTLGPRLTRTQLQSAWTYIGSVRGEISGVVVPADGDAPGYRVTLEDVAAAPFTDAHGAAA